MRVRLERGDWFDGQFIITDLDSGKGLGGRTPFDDHSNKVLERAFAAGPGYEFAILLYILKDGLPYLENEGDKRPAMETVFMTVVEVG